jgi:hypothetical protein
MKRENMSGRNWRGKTCQVGTNMLFFVQNWICSYAFDWLILKFMKRSAANLYQYHRWRTNLDVHLDRSFHTARGPGHRNLCGRGAFPLLLPSSVLSLVVVAARSGKLRSPANGAVSEAPSHWSHLVVREREIGKKWVASSSPVVHINPRVSALVPSPLSSAGNRPDSASFLLSIHVGLPGERGIGIHLSR